MVFYKDMKGQNWLFPLNILNLIAEKTTSVFLSMRL